MFNYRKHEKYHGSVFSFGAGVQSTAILLLIKHEPQRLLEKIGHLPKFGLFADTGAESQQSLDNFYFCQKISPIPLYRVKNFKRNAQTNLLDIPFYINDTFNTQRQCTKEWKIVPINRAIKKLYPQRSVKNIIAVWLGISIDEMSRMKISPLKSHENVYPLIDLELSRQDCYSILKKYNVEPVKSCCYMCPFQVKHWGENKELDKAINYEKQLQKIAKETKINGVPYLHPFQIPLEDAVNQQQAQTNLFTFNDECDGYCGV